MSQPVAFLVHQLNQPLWEAAAQTIDIVVRIDVLLAREQKFAELCFSGVKTARLRELAFPQKVADPSHAVSCGRTSGTSGGWVEASAPANGLKP